MPFCSDAVGLLGVALGARSLAVSGISSQIAVWLSKFLPDIYRLDGTDSWQRSVFQGCSHVLGNKVTLPTSGFDQAEDALVSLAAKNILPHPVGAQAEKDETAALKLILSQGVVELSFERAAVRLAALEYVVRAAPAVVPARISAKDLVRLLERIPAGLRKWTWEMKPRTANAPVRQWHIDNEYHVQNLLWVILAPIFPDLDDEQYLAKVGQKSPRADLHIPSMKLIIEAKFLRPEDSMQKIIDEISSDTGLYSAMGNDCAGIIPIIWDDSARSHEHDYLRQGLKKLPKIIDAIVIPRPGWITADQSGISTKTKGKQTKRSASKK